MRATVILAVLALVQCDSEPPNDKALKYKVMFYMWSLHIAPNNNLLEYLGLNLIKYGYLHSNCDHSRDDFNSNEEVHTENNIWVWKKGMDLEYSLGTFYEYYILPEGKDDALILWYNFMFFFKQYQIFNPLAKFYTINQMRGCPIRGKLCQRSLPELPDSLQFTEGQCKKVSLYIKNMTFRLYKELENIIAYTIPFDYYTIAIYLLRNFPIVDVDTNYVDKEEKIFQLEAYLKGALQVDKDDCTSKYSKFLAHRNEKEALIEADLKEASDEKAKKVIEKKLHLHKTITNMMVKGWEYVN